MVLTSEQENKQLRIRLKILDLDSQITKCKLSQLEYQLKMQDLKLKRETLRQEYEHLLPSNQLQTPPLKSHMFIEEPSPTASECFQQQQQAPPDHFLQGSPMLSPLVQFNQSYHGYQEGHSTAEDEKPKQCDHCDATESESWKYVNGKVYCRNCGGQYYYYVKTRGKEIADKQFLDKICRDENGKIIKRKKTKGVE